MKTNDLIATLPGEALVRAGLADLSAGRCTIAACLAAIAWPRLVKAGIIGDSPAAPVADPEFQLYRLLRGEGGDAYSRYNSLIRELVSFEHALDRRIRRRKPEMSASRINGEPRTED